eukprot:5764962-Pyramimonas_sp.AAC.1
MARSGRAGRAAHHLMSLTHCVRFSICKTPSGSSVSARTKWTCGGSQTDSQTVIQTVSKTDS